MLAKPSFHENVLESRHKMLRHNLAKVGEIDGVRVRFTIHVPVQGFKLCIFVCELSKVNLQLTVAMHKIE